VYILPLVDRREVKARWQGLNIDFQTILFFLPCVDPQWSRPTVIGDGSVLLGMQIQMIVKKNNLEPVHPERRIVRAGLRMEEGEPTRMMAESWIWTLRFKESIMRMMRLESWAFDRIINVDLMGKILVMTED
jgi:hypothetical protein